MCIFDLDGTLAHTLPTIATTVNAVLAKHGFQTYPEAEHVRFIGHGIETAIETALGKKLPEDSQEFRDICKECMEGLVEAAPRVQLFPGVLGVVRRLAQQGVLLAVLSNKPDSSALETVTLCFREDAGLFFKVLGLTPGGVAKPDPCGVYAIANAIKAAHGDSGAPKVVFVGDSWIDAVTARNAGIPSVGCRWGYAGERGLGDFSSRISTPEELETEILRLLE